MDRAKTNALSFLDHLQGALGYKLRPVGLLILQQVELLGLNFSKEARANLSAQALRDQVNAFLFLQAAPLEQVSRAVRAFCYAEEADRRAAWDDLMCKYVEPFLATAEPEHEAELSQQLDQLDEIVAAQVEAQPPPTSGHTRRERPDPNS